ncbi:MAG: hypothetical protein IKT94_03090 [Rikenellaceae bacterium]|nr:hypothetical protein [Rikenellaceae bacterium]
MRSLRYILHFATLLIVGCDYDRFDPIEPRDETEWVPNAELSDVRHSFAVATTIREDMVITGRVVTSDEGGNFYRTLVIEDATGALELMIGMDYLYRTYPVGSLLAVRLQGLAIDEYNGVLRVGLQPESWDYRTTSYMSHQAIVDRYVYRANSLVAPEPKRLSAGELTKHLCGRLVTVENLRADDEAATWAEGRYTSYRKFRDERSDSIYVQTSPYARFAAQELPSDEVSITGVLYYGEVSGGRKTFIIKMCDEKGVVR